MEFEIKYINSKADFSYFNVNGFDAKFATKSNKEVLLYLQNMENVLTKDLRFGSIQDLDSDIFRAIEYFSQVHPNMVISFMENAKEQLLIELGNLKIRKQATMKGIMKHICNLPVMEINEDDNLLRINANIAHNLLYTKKILNDLFHKVNKVTKLSINKSFQTPFGILTCLGKKYASSFYMWELDGETNAIFEKCDKSIDELADIIITTLSDVHVKVTNRIMSELVDFTDVEDIKMIILYTKAHRDLMKKYLEIIFQNNIKNGLLLYEVGFVNGFTSLNILQTLSKNKDEEIIKEKRTNRNMEFLNSIFRELTDEYLIKQVEYRIANNTFDASQDLWTYYYLRNGKLRYTEFDFTILKNSSVKREFKLYVKNLIAIDSQTKNTTRGHKHLDYKLGWYRYIRASIDYFITKHHINCFADITPDMVSDYLKDLEFDGLNGGEKKSIRIIQTCINSLKLFSKWIRKNANKINTIRPVNNVFETVIFTGEFLIKQEQEETEVIPDFVIKQILENLQYLKPEVYKRLLLSSLNTPRRYNELQLLDIGSIQPIIINGAIAVDEFGKQLFQITFIEHKKQLNKEIVNKGLNYNKKQKVIPVNFIVAREVEEQTKETMKLQMEINNERPDNDKIKIDKVFVVKDNTMKEGYSLIDNINFVDAINRFIRNCGIKKVDGEFWNFGTRQTRTTGTNSMVVLGYHLDVIQKILGHEHSTTTYKDYIKISHLHIAEGNTEFMRSEFDDLFLEKKDSFDEYELVALFNKYCLDYNKIYYNRKLLGICGLKVGEKCPKAEGSSRVNPKDELPCADCPSLYVGEACKPGWESICEQCKSDVDVLESFFNENNISMKNAFKVHEYKTAYVKYIKSQKVLEAISDIGGI